MVNFIYIYIYCHFTVPGACRCGLVPLCVTLTAGLLVGFVFYELVFFFFMNSDNLRRPFCCQFVLKEHLSPLKPSLARCGGADVRSEPAPPSSLESAPCLEVLLGGGARAHATVKAVPSPLRWLCAAGWSWAALQGPLWSSALPVRPNGSTGVGSGTPSSVLTSSPS